MSKKFPNTKKWYSNGLLNEISVQRVSDTDALDDIVGAMINGYSVDAEDADTGFKVTVYISPGERIEYLLGV